MSVAAPVNPRRRPATRAHKLAVKIYFVVCAVVVGIALFPIRYTSLRMALIVGVFGLWAGALFLFWDRLLVRLLCLLVAAGTSVLLLLPTRSVDTDALRAEYVRALQSYQGTPYVWGGETKLGIDCSGLVRAGMIDAEAREALRAQNFVLLRKAASLWWNDFSAAAISDEFQGRTRKVGEFASLNETDYRRLLPGDLAITGGKQHVLAYAGDKTWIEADPTVMKTVSVRAPSQDGWFVQQVQVMRWRILEPTAPTVEPR